MGCGNVFGADDEPDTFAQAVAVTLGAEGNILAGQEIRFIDQPAEHLAPKELIDVVIFFARLGHESPAPQSGAADAQDFAFAITLVGDHRDLAGVGAGPAPRQDDRQRFLLQYLRHTDHRGQLADDRVGRPCAVEAEDRIHPAFGGQFETDILDRLSVPDHRFQAGNFRALARIRLAAGEHDAAAALHEIIPQELQFLRIEHGIHPAAEHQAVILIKAVFGPGQGEVGAHGLPVEVVVRGFFLNGEGLVAAELEHGADFQIRIGVQRTQQKTRVPVRLGLHQQHPRFLIDHADKKRAPVVACVGLAGQRLDGDSVFEGAFVVFLDREFDARRPLLQIHLARRHVLVLPIQIHFGVPVLVAGLGKVHFDRRRLLGKGKVLVQARRDVHILGLRQRTDARGPDRNLLRFQMGRNAGHVAARVVPPVAHQQDTGAFAALTGVDGPEQRRRNIGFRPLHRLARCQFLKGAGQNLARKLVKVHLVPLAEFVKKG